MKNKFYILLLSTILASCSGTVKKHWNCGAPEGQGCSSIEEADGLSITNDNNQSKASPSYVVNLKKTPKSKNGSVSLPKNNNFIYTRTKEAADRVWFAPFLDEDGNQHEESYVRVIVDKPQWVVSDEIN